MKCYPVLYSWSCIHKDCKYCKTYCSISGSVFSSLEDAKKRLWHNSREYRVIRLITEIPELIEEI